MKTKKRVKRKKSKKHSLKKKTYKKQLGGSLTQEQSLYLNQEQDVLNNEFQSRIMLSPNVANVARARSAIPREYKATLVYKDGEITNRPAFYVDMMYPVVWPLLRKNVENFTSHVTAELNECDCVINALQMLGLLDIVSANVLRLAFGVKGVDVQRCSGGMSDASIILLLGYLNIVRGLTSSFYLYDKYIIGSGRIGLVGWGDAVKEILPGTATFGGYQKLDNNINHVFLIYNDNGKLMLIDPQLPSVGASKGHFIANRGVCSLEEPECAEYLSSIADKNASFYLYAISKVPVTHIEWIKELGFNPDPNASGRGISKHIADHISRREQQQQQQQLEKQRQEQPSESMEGITQPNDDDDL